MITFDKVDKWVATGITLLAGGVVLGDILSVDCVTDHTRECLQQVTGNSDFRGTLTPEARAEVEACMVNAGHGQRYTRARLGCVLGEVDGQN